MLALTIVYVYFVDDRSIEIIWALGVISKLANLAFNKVN